MEINMHSRCTTVLCLLFVLLSWTDTKADEHSFDVAINRTYIELLHKNLTIVKRHTDYLNESVSAIDTKLEEVVEDIGELNKTLQKEVRGTRELQEKFQNKIEKQIAGFERELEEAKRELAENRNALEQKCVASLQVLNETVHRIDKAVNQYLAWQVPKQNQKADFALFENSTVFQDVLKHISQFRENYVSKDELKELQRDKRAIRNKCSLNVRHKPEGNRFDVRMVMDPPCTEPAESN